MACTNHTVHIVSLRRVIQSEYAYSEAMGQLELATKERSSFHDLGRMILVVSHFNPSTHTHTHTHSGDSSQTAGSAERRPTLG